MLLTYGGISALVIAFTMYPIALAVFKSANLPRRLIPGVIAAGCFTFAATAFPGTPQTINLIPPQYIGTNGEWSAPVLGIICGLIGTFLLVIYVYHEGAAARKKGDGFEADENTLKILAEAEKLGDGVNPILALVPIIVIIVLLVAAKMNVTYCIIDRQYFMCGFVP